MTNHIMTTQGVARLQQKLETMYLRLKEIQSEKAHAYHASGDGWHDNPGWLQLGQQEEQLSLEIQMTQQRLASAKVVNVQQAQPSGEVQLGSRVHYIMTALKGGRPVSWTMEIAGSGESNIREKRISYDSPIGKALLGKKPGDVVEVGLPTGVFQLTVEKIE